MPHRKTRLIFTVPAHVGQHAKEWSDIWARQFAEFIGIGNDYIHADPDAQHLRLNAHDVVK